jgi:hypothetical protein
MEGRWRLWRGRIMTHPIELRDEVVWEINAKTIPKEIAFGLSATVVNQVHRGDKNVPFSLIFSCIILYISLGT